MPHVDSAATGLMEPYLGTQPSADLSSQADLQALFTALNQSLAMLELRMDGSILHANEAFLRAVGYSAEQVRGKHHRLLIDESYAVTNSYQEFWTRLNQGAAQSGEYLLIGNGGAEVWILGSYTPVWDSAGKAVKVVCFASIITDDVAIRQDRQKAVEQILGSVQAAIQGDLTRRIAFNDGGSFGQIGAGVDALFETLQNDLRRVFETAQSVTQASLRIGSISEQIATHAQQTASEAESVAASSDEVSQSVSTLAAASKEMLASIREISKNSNESARVAQNAVVAAENANQTISKLSDSSVEIGKVIKVITSIAQQTNLLALNATIEAARAGDAGKGFAVVANEVKELSKETARSADEIARKVEVIQTDITCTVKAIGEIGSIIDQISDFSNSIASAVEQQTATTNQMGRNMSGAVNGAGEIAGSIAAVAKSAYNTTAGAGEAQQAAEALKNTSYQLQELVRRFTV